MINNWLIIYSREFHIAPGFKDGLLENSPMFHDFPIGPMERTVRLRLPALFAWKNMHPGKSVKSNMKSKYDP